MTKTILNNNLSYVKLLNPVMENVISWDFQEVRGIGLFSKMEKYGHIELKIYKSNHTTSYVIWNIKEEQTPNGYRKPITEYLQFFVNYATVIKGHLVQGLTFEVIDGTFNRDSRPDDFGTATAYAIRHCFDQSFFNLREQDLKRIDNSRTNGLTLLNEIVKRTSQPENE